MSTVERRTRREESAQRRMLMPLIAVWGLGALTIAAILATYSLDDTQLLLDPTSVAGLPWYTGLVSNLGVLAWTLGTVAAAGAAHVAHLAGRDAAASFLRQGALLAALLTLDDLFRLHSSALPKLFGVPKLVVLAVYALLGVAWVVVHHREILRTRWVVLVGAVAPIGLSVLFDLLGTGSGNWIVIEDTAKFLGVLAWASYFVLTARDIASSVIRELLHQPVVPFDQDAVNA
ncbi:MAG: hypothetical protein HKN94_06465 [Acidimicrobiales bacterium]|nr:hypothetical protein [Acidimicrobiales bacterium]RZV47478.1 MAG: hypothetical protein EX269_04745 [Acidimicrobiales bacterium]